MLPTKNITYQHLLFTTNERKFTMKSNYFCNLVTRRYAGILIIIKPSLYNAH